MILTNGSVIIRCVKPPVLSNAPLCAYDKKTLQLQTVLQSHFLLILHIYTPSCAMLLWFLHIVCALATFHIVIHSYFRWYLTEHKVAGTKWVLLWPKWTNCLVYCSWSRSPLLSISTIMQSRRNMGTNLLNRQWTKHAVWCTKIPAYSCSVLCSMSRHEFQQQASKSGEALTATLNVPFQLCQPHKAPTMISIR